MIHAEGECFINEILGTSSRKALDRLAARLKQCHPVPKSGIDQSGLLVNGDQVAGRGALLRFMRSDGKSPLSFKPAADPFGTDARGRRPQASGPAGGEASGFGAACRKSFRAHAVADGNGRGFSKLLPPPSILAGATVLLVKGALHGGAEESGRSRLGGRLTFSNGFHQSPGDQSGQSCLESHSGCGR